MGLLHFHSLLGEHWPCTIFYFYSVTAHDCFPKLFIIAEERIEANLQLSPPCNFEKLPDKKSETHTAVVASTICVAFTPFCVPEICVDFLLPVLTSFPIHLHFVQVVLVNARLAQEGWDCNVYELLLQSFIGLLSSKTWFDLASLC